MKEVVLKRLFVEKGEHVRRRVQIEDGSGVFRTSSAFALTNRFFRRPSSKDATRNKCIASSNKDATRNNVRCPREFLVSPKSARVGCGPKIVELWGQYSSCLLCLYFARN